MKIACSGDPVVVAAAAQVDALQPRGGMGQVFLARDVKLARRVAIKFMTIVSRDLTERFLAEARTTAAVSHENIVVIHDVDEHQGSPHMVLEFLEGTPLRELMGDQPLPASRVIELMVPVGRALVRAHSAGVVHRDLKPENILITVDGGVKVLDFGIAKALAGPGETPRRFSPLGVRQRYASAEEPLAELEALLPGRYGRRLAEHPWQRVRSPDVGRSPSVDLEESALEHVLGDRAVADEVRRVVEEATRDRLVERAERAAVAVDVVLHERDPILRRRPHPVVPLYHAPFIASCT